MITIDFTYQTVTPESAEHGDFSASGFITRGGWKYSPDDYERNEIKAPGDLRAAIDYARELGICCDSGSWLSSVDSDVNYQTGEDTLYNMHIAGCTPATEARIIRILTEG